MLSRLTVRSNWSEKIKSRSRRGQAVKRGAALRRRHLEAAVELGHVVLAQKAVGFAQGC